MAITGRLTRSNGEWVIEVGSKQYNWNKALDLASALRDRPDDQLNGRRVTFDVTGKSGARNVALAQGEKPLPPAAPRPATVPAPAPGGRSVIAPRQQDAFHNPYTFVPAPSRRAVPDGSPLGDDIPAGHDRLHPDRWTGAIGVTMTTVTPLLALDADARHVDPSSGHATYDVATTPDGGQPYVAPTAIKGMLRTAIEAITNSRFGVFADHDDQLAYRMRAQEGIDMHPVRVTGDGAHLELYEHAAWLPCYGDGGLHAPVNYSDGTRPQHGHAVDVAIEAFAHYRWDPRARRYATPFPIWRVRAIARKGQPLPPVVATPRSPTFDVGRHQGKSYYHPTGAALRQATGYVCRTNQNINGKHDERVFIDRTGVVQLEDRLRTAWRAVVRSYKAAHTKREIWERPDGQQSPASPEKYLGPKTGQTAWSRHVYTPDSEVLSPGTLCYARYDQTRIEGLYPVYISRNLYPYAPAALLRNEKADHQLLPARSIEELSPADRMFGWVRQERGQPTHGRDDVAWRGRVRIGTPICTTPNAIDRFTPSVPLAILGQPKPQQARFYLRQNPDDPRPLAEGASAPGREESYDLAKHRGAAVARDHTLGRKVYPHHAGLPDSYWDRPNVDRTQTAEGGRFQEYRRPTEPLNRDAATLDESRSRYRQGTKEQRDDQNRSISSWVKPDVIFDFTIQVTDLSAVELGALLWVLKLPAEHYLRLGYGKPLGFGSVRLQIDPARTTLANGRERAAQYADLRTSLRGVTEQSPVDASRTEARIADRIDDYRRAVEKDIERFDRVPYIAAFLWAARGDDKVPVHYPRVRPAEMDPTVPAPPDPSGQNFKWFVANEKYRDKQFVHAASLPNAGDGTPLTVYTEDRASTQRGGAANGPHR